MDDICEFTFEPSRVQTSGAGGERRVRGTPASVSTADEITTTYAASSLTAYDEIDNQRMAEVQRRLVLLEQAYYDDYGLPLQSGGRRGFECFMQYNPFASMPRLGVESTGFLTATWLRGEQCLSIRFNDRYQFDYALAINNPNGVIERFWGVGHLMNFFATFPVAKRLVTPV